MSTLEPKLILGIGTGRCGTRSLRDIFLEKSLMKTNNTRISKFGHCLHEGSPGIWFDKFKVHSKLTEDDYRRMETQVITYIDTHMNDHDLKFHVHIDFKLLNYIDIFVNKYDNIAIVALKRDKKSFVKSVVNSYFLKPLNTHKTNQYQDNNAYFYHYYLGEQCPEVIQIVEKFYSKYWDDYNTYLDELVLKYPNKIKCYDYNDVLNKWVVQKDMFTFCGL
jgi:hypothetical protein